MKPLNHTQLGALFKADSVAYYLYCAMVAAHRKGNTKRRDEIKEFTTKAEQETVLKISKT